MGDTPWLYRLDELGGEHNDIVGKKCAQLGEMMRAGFRVPPGFALSLEAYEKFMDESGASREVRGYLNDFTADPNDPADLPKYDKASKVVRAILETRAIPADMEALIGRYYDELSRTTGVHDVPVATRSAGPASHPGQYETFLHVRGKPDLMKNIVKVWSSTFNQRSLHMRHRLDLPLDRDPIGVAVLKMVNAKAAGIMFTLNPANGDRSKIIIQGNWGLGESVVSGSVTPDEWIVDKVVLEISRRTISSKSTICVYDDHSGRVRMLEMPPDRMTVACLNDEEIVEIAGAGKRLEQHCGTPQDIEWTIDEDLELPENIFLVQTRPETIWSKKKAPSKLKTTGSGAGDVIQFYRNIKA